MNRLYPVLEGVNFIRTTVPMKCHERDLAASGVTFIHELRDPIHVPNHLGRTHFDALKSIWLKLLHEQTHSSVRVNVGLTLDVRFVEGKNVFDMHIVNLFLALMPFVHFRGTPESGDVFKSLEFLYVTILPMVIPRYILLVDSLGPCIEGAPGETIVEVGNNRSGCEQRSGCSGKRRNRKLHVC